MSDDPYWPEGLPPLNAAGLRVEADDPHYASCARVEAEFWSRPQLTPPVLRANFSRAVRRYENEAYTGDPERSWLDDIIERGPFEDVAVLGASDGAYEAPWVAAGASRHTVVYDLSPGVLGKTRRALGPWWRRWSGPARRLRCVQADLNFLELPVAAFDAIWSTGVLHHVVNLEALVAQVVRALRPGGLFAFEDYTGEARLRYAPARLATANAVYATVPACYRLEDVPQLVRPPWDAMSPFEAVTSDRIVSVLDDALGRVHLGGMHRLFPLLYQFDWRTLAREDRALEGRLLAADREAAGHGIAPCMTYGVYRKATA